MENTKQGLVAAVAAGAALLAEALGGWDGALQLLIGMMAADYLTGVAVAAIWHRSDKSESGTLSSKAGFKGLCRKGAMLLVVWVAVLLDRAMEVSYTRTAVCFFFAGNEGLSLMENLGLMGAPFPKFLKKALEALKEKGEDGDGSDDDGGEAGEDRAG